MLLETFSLAAFLYALCSYVTLNYLSASHYIAMSEIQRDPPGYNHGSITTPMLPSSIHFDSIGWSGSNKNYQAFENSLKTPGPELSKSTCITHTLGIKNVDLCFWVERSFVLISDAYYPKGDFRCIHSNSCFIEIPIKLASNGTFLPNAGFASTTIPKHIHPVTRVNDTLTYNRIPYDTKFIRHPWIRTLHWKYEGIYTLSSRPYKEFEFTYYFPAILPSGTPNVIYGLCHLSAIKDGTCSQDIFKSAYH